MTLVVLGLGSPGCKPELGVPPSLVATPRLLDVRAMPAEVKPGADVTLDALLADSDGALAAPIAWTICRTPKPPAESNAVNQVCVDQPDDAAPLLGPAAVTVPADACTLFGPLTPPVRPGQPATRPRDPDPTGGFYQPIRAAAHGVAGTDGDLLGFALVRVTCPLANAAIEVAQKFSDPVAGYHPNNGPAFSLVTATDAGGQTSTVAGSGAAPLTVPAGAILTLETNWPAETAESFLVFDLDKRDLVTAREALRVSWFATAGEFLHDRTGRDASDADTFSENTWTASGIAGPATVHFWIVLRDSRGGADFTTFDVDVSPP